MTLPCHWTINTEDDYQESMQVFCDSEAASPGLRLFVVIIAGCQPGPAQPGVSTLQWSDIVPGLSSVLS